MTTTMEKTIQSRYRGALVGLAVGDAIGAPVEFQSRDSFAPVTGMKSGGPHNLNAGEWTDDTSMALCLAEALIDYDGKFVPDAIMGKFVRWWQDGYMSVKPFCFDIGNTTAGALAMYKKSGRCGGTADTNSAGNGSLMRLAPAVMVRSNLFDSVLEARSSSRLTHGNPDCVLACEIFASYLWRALHGDGDKASVLAPPLTRFAEDSPLMEVACGSYRYKDRDEIKSTGYVVHTLEAALWAFWHTTDFASAVLMAANLGDDADTVAAVTGQIAGAFYGIGAIPADWLQTLAKRNRIQAMADRLYEISTRG